MATFIARDIADGEEVSGRARSWRTCITDPTNALPSNVSVEVELLVEVTP